MTHMTQKKMYLVKREVMATSMLKAMREKGKIYEIVELAEKDQPIQEKQIIGFKIEKPKRKK